MRISRIPASAILVLTVALLAGCGGKVSEVSADTAPFEQAVAAYCESKSMDMKVVEFKSLDIEGDKATAVCSMTEKSDMYNIKVRWRFEFAKEGDAWRVERYEGL